MTTKPEAGGPIGCNGDPVAGAVAAMNLNHSSNQKLPSGNGSS
jgi:hypothetical protein